MHCTNSSKLFMDRIFSLPGDHVENILSMNNFDELVQCMGEDYIYVKVVKAEGELSMQYNSQHGYPVESH